jgi:hypothetical protein
MLMPHTFSTEIFHDDDGIVSVNDCKVNAHASGRLLYFTRVLLKLFSSVYLGPVGIGGETTPLYVVKRFD